MSIGCPAGLSAGPVFAAHNELFRVHGVVTQNLKSVTVLDAVEELDIEGGASRHTYQRIINHRLCVLIEDVKQWVDRHAPPRSPQV